jgi:hypothetical protein
MATNTVKAGQYLNLDAIFAGEIELDKYDTKGVFALKTMSRIKLAKAKGLEANGETVYSFYGFGGWTAEAEGRVEPREPLVPGPQAYLFTHDVYITAHEEPEETAYVVDFGSVLKLLGTYYLVVESPRADLELMPML